MKIINVIHQESEPALLSTLAENEFAVYELDSSGIADMNAFYQKLISILPVGIPLSGNVNWDAFLDSVWEGIAGLEEKNVAILWKNAHTFSMKRMAGFIQIVDVLLQLSDTLATGIPKSNLIIIISGNEESYRQ